MKKIIALAVATAISAPAMADLTIGGSYRYDARSTNGADFDVATNRALLSFSGSSTAESGMFVSAGATLQILGEAGAAGDNDDSGATKDGNVAITVGNAAANVILGSFEPAGAFSNGPDAFRNSSATIGTVSGDLRGRDNSNIGLNVTAVEGLTLQLSTAINDEAGTRVVAGYDFGDFAVTAAMESIDGDDNLSTVTASTSVAGVAVNASYGSQGDASSTNLNVAYMGFALALANDDTGTATEQEVYGTYAVANAAGVEGLTVTVGYGSSDEQSDDTYGVRLDYAF